LLIMAADVCRIAIAPPLAVCIELTPGYLCITVGLGI
jgi:hypothetical protein